MKREESRQWLLWLFIAATLPVVYLVVQEPEATRDQDISVERSDVSSVPTVSRASSEHELVALASELEKNPGHVPVLLRMAQVSRDLSRTDEVTRYLREALAAEPENGEARLELGRALYESGDLAGALAETSRLVEEDPQNVDALYNLGAIYGNMMDDGQARKYWERAVALEPDSPSGRLAAQGLKKLSPEVADLGAPVPE